MLAFRALRDLPPWLRRAVPIRMQGLFVSRRGDANRWLRAGGGLHGIPGHGIRPHAGMIQKAMTAH